MAEKVYCIVKRNGNYYIPVKAEYNPYVSHQRKKAYLACLPNFFGGNIERGECYYLGLAREVKEESQGRVSIDAECLRASNFQLLYHYQYQYQHNEKNYTDYLNFYLVTVMEEGEYFAGNCTVLDVNVRNHPNPAEREMSCILKIPVSDIAGNNIENFLAICKAFGGDLVNINPKNSDDTPNKVFSDWNNDRGTKDAFEELLKLRP